jgi:hypothetical protein
MPGCTESHQLLPVLLDPILLDFTTLKLRKLPLQSQLEDLGDPKG